MYVYIGPMLRLKQVKKEFEHPRLRCSSDICERNTLVEYNTVKFCPECGSKTEIVTSRIERWVDWGWFAAENPLFEDVLARVGFCDVLHVPNDFESVASLNMFASENIDSPSNAAFILPSSLFSENLWEEKLELFKQIYADLLVALQDYGFSPQIVLGFQTKESSHR